jgi:glutaredoxin
MRMDIRWTANCLIQRRMLTAGPSSMSPGKRIALFGISAFAGTAAVNHWYQSYKSDKIRKDMLSAQLYFDNEKREVVHQSGQAVNGPGSMIQTLTSDQVEKIRSVPVSFRIAGPTVIPGVKLTLFQYTSCPFCCKVRSVLDYYGLSYEVIEVNPVLRSQLKVLPIDGRKKVPVLVISRDTDNHPQADGREKDEKDKDRDTFFIDEPLQLRESSLIISLLASYFTCNPGLQDNLNVIAEMYPAITLADFEENKSVKEVVNKYFLMKGEPVL